ncbi:hypothetical protein Pst134EA_000405 [Puccinia striiformis f. sp. tritici]|uniref:hypothetical protein n=1 Tax=Puccinia striiformis f. sp. tritici TaxID=168172 RepID=UPI0020072EE3|nr:hypothetical protein Pst134EA_000405 [Puccinia striiformis f. sp. tritici]KAH9473332.1 hypothetical protein Pst134EA_000405 [Puccinia striiformis f. sp. tritici]
MATVRAPNHPVNVSGLFETLDEFVPKSTRANQYGNVTTPSCVSCAGLYGTSPKDFEMNLTTNTALNNVLQSSSIYFLAGRLLAPNNGSTPTLSYHQTSVVRNGPAGPTAPDFTNKVNVTGLGVVISCQEVVASGDDSPSHLKVTVQHSDWDSITHGLYLVGRELEITGNLVDFDMEDFTAVVSVTSVAVTTGHQLGRNSQSTSTGPSGSKSGKKFKPSKPKGPLGDSSKTGFTSSSRDTPPAQDSPCASMKGKGKELTSTGNAIDTDDYDSDSPIASASTPSSSKIRPRPDFLSDAAKRMKK